MNYYTNATVYNMEPGSEEELEVRSHDRPFCYQSCMIFSPLNLPPCDSAYCSSPSFCCSASCSFVDPFTQQGFRSPLPLRHAEVMCEEP